MSVADTAISRRPPVATGIIKSRNKYGFVLIAFINFLASSTLICFFYKGYRQVSSLKDIARLTYVSQGCPKIISTLLRSKSYNINRTSASRR